ncbi:UvrD-helicase domain-containing protein [Paenibacillus sp. N1-5-1-14]|uniref:RNA polymerase recycling motor HelD n=1 Tax=Paenibacillus radicibacter TaxID=2972488 RepID=UPI0021593747|nr:RNA polymerase recycling motor HelD [Paenibacillus radicibacter]MCR8641759.1 UvrD-helicase domain-containing protein [Paenibacillus radicibacter]
MINHNWNEEVAHSQLVTKQIQRRIETLSDIVGQVRTDVIEIRKDFWDDVTIDLSSFDDKLETALSLKQQAEMLSQRELNHRQASLSLSRMSRLLQSPYFGRIDFKEDGEQTSTPVYLGIASLLHEDEHSFLVYDWRAPISSLYYTSGPGHTTYETPMGKIEGDITVKRQYGFRDGELDFMFDTNDTIGDEVLQQVLSRTSDTQMKSIVATIQKEQNAVIRNDHSRLLIVLGSAGSGKTSAALQRVAYLLYKHRDHLSADQVVLFSPNSMFNSYISSVLPELGEENMQQTTFQQYLNHRLADEFDVEDPFSQLEYVLSVAPTPDYAARLQGIQYKSSTAFLHVITNYRNDLLKQGMLFKPVMFRGHEIVSNKEMITQFYSYDSSIRLPNRIDLMRTWLKKKIRKFATTQIEAPWVEDEMDLLDIEDFHASFNHLHHEKNRKEETFNDYDVEKEFLARKIVKKHFKPINEWVQQLGFVHTSAIYRQLFRNPALIARLADADLGEAELPELWSKICESTIRRLDEQELAYEDATPFLYLKELLQSFQVNTIVRHVLIDEAQDYSPFQFEFIKRLFPRAKMTVLGDLNQAIYVHDAALTQEHPMSALFGPEQTQWIRLQRSYRSTREIVEFTRGMVPGGDAIIPFNRDGDKPLVTVLPDSQALHQAIVDQVKSLLDNNYASVAIICKTAQESEAVYEKLSHTLPVRLITKNSPTFEKGILVLPAYLAKGVEFDAVLIYDGSNEQYSKEHERKLFYTACTRAMHYLHIYALRTPSHFITEQSPETYQTAHIRV